MTTSSGIRFTILGALMLSLICLFAGRAQADTIRLNVFERFRNEMVIDQKAAAAKFMNAGALHKWTTGFVPFFADDQGQLRHFFAFAMTVPKKKGELITMIYFNPWVDGALFTRWRAEGELWKLDDFYLASGERIRGEITAGAKIEGGNIPPIWLWFKGPLLRNLIVYYRDMRTRLLNLDGPDLAGWFSRSADERTNDLLRVKLRMSVRAKAAATYLANGRSGPVLAGAVSKLKYDALTHNKNNLAAYSRHADMLGALRPEIVKTFKENWIFTKDNVYTLILSSIAAPRLLVFMNINPSGRIEGALLADLETMAMWPQTPAQSAAPAKAAAKVKTFTDAEGNRVEITTEKRAGKVVMTTRVNGKVTERVEF